MLPNPGQGHGEGPVPGLVQVAESLEHDRRRGHWRRGLVVSIFTVALVTVGAEAWLRLSGYRQAYFEASLNRTSRRWVELTTAGIFEERADPVRRYGMRPGASCEVDGLTFRISSHGTRGEDFPLAKPPGEQRLLCLGDSFAFGLWCDEDETLVGHLARRANEALEAQGAEHRWRAIDLGVPGYHSGQQLHAFETEGLALDPDLVVLWFNTNDVEQEGFFFDQGMGVLRRDFLPLPTGLRRVLWSSHLYGWIVARHRAYLEGGPVPPILDPGVPYAFVREDNQRATRAAIARIAALCEQAGVPLFFVNMPHLTWQGEIQDPNWAMAPLVDWAQGVSDELGLPSVNLLGLFRGYADGVDRSAEGSPPDFLLDLYGSDPRIRALVAWAKERAASEGLDWEALGVAERKRLVSGYAGTIPEQPDFHLTGEGYGHIARVVYDALVQAELLP